ncbi:hypothetical protein PsorP6_001697 [Peronosclerospora sorghi]|uniref:Uncharacterized protein n=1 Tax=Peronosclerospora sorghi TaxID=230839 RepID=A0ACC0WS97_9STRA|nr:hypothetical protein PsorP6_001697 [Peronosclerospora sorghi]
MRPDREEILRQRFHTARARTALHARGAWSWRVISSWPLVALRHRATRPGGASWPTPGASSPSSRARRRDPRNRSTGAHNISRPVWAACH